MSGGIRNWLVITAIGCAALAIFVFAGTRSAPEAEAGPEALAKRAQDARPLQAASATPSERRAASPERGVPGLVTAGGTRARASLDAEDLIEAGVSPDRVERILGHIEDTNSRRTALIDAISTMERGKKRFALRQELWQLDAEDAIAFGEDNAKVRYAAGENNAVYIDSLPERQSRGRDAGLLPGDQVVSFDGEEIYSAYQLQLLTRESTGKSRVTVVFLRDGEERETTLRGGGLGWFLKEDSKPPG